MIGQDELTNAEMNALKRCFSVNCTVWASIALTDSTCSWTGRQRALICGSSFPVLKTTSSAVNGAPSFHVALSCRVNVYVRPSSDFVHDFARQGYGFRSKL